MNPNDATAMSDQAIEKNGNIAWLAALTMDISELMFAEEGRHFL